MPYSHICRFAFYFEPPSTYVYAYTYISIWTSLDWSGPVSYGGHRTVEDLLYGTHSIGIITGRDQTGFDDKNPSLHIGNVGCPFLERSLC